MKNKSIKKLIRIAVLSLFGIIQTAKAECTYDQMLVAEEFQVGVMLSWSTLNENNNSMFVIEKSENGTTFTPIGTLRGAGTSATLKKYNFLDIQASAKKVFYRLKQVDFDGKFSYTESLSMNKKLETNVMLVQLSSETVNKSFDFTVDALKEGGIVIQLLDGTGKVTWQATKMLTTGLNNLNVDMSSQSEGIYKVRIMMDKDQKDLTIRKMDDMLKRNNIASDKKSTGKN